MFAGIFHNVYDCPHEKLWGVGGLTCVCRSSITSLSSPWEIIDWCRISLRNICERFVSLGVANITYNGISLMMSQWCPQVADNYWVRQSWTVSWTFDLCTLSVHSEPTFRGLAYHSSPQQQPFVILPLYLRFLNINFSISWCPRMSSSWELRVYKIDPWEDSTPL